MYAARVRKTSQRKIKARSCARWDSDGPAAHEALGRRPNARVVVQMADTPIEEPVYLNFGNHIRVDLNELKQKGAKAIDAASSRFTSIEKTYCRMWKANGETRYALSSRKRELNPSEWETIEKNRKAAGAWGDDKVCAEEMVILRYGTKFAYSLAGDCRKSATRLEWKAACPKCGRILRHFGIDDLYVRAKEAEPTPVDRR